MKHVLITLFALIALGCTQQSQAGDFLPGTHYVELDPHQPTSVADGEVEVIEFFWYGCPHCFSLEPHMQSWSESKPEKVVFKRVPAVLNPNWEILGRAYYTAEALNVVDIIHPAIFEKIHVDRQMITSESRLRDLFQEKAGISAEDFDKAWNSFAVQSQIKRSNMLGRRYRLTGVPAVIINGKFATDATKAKGYANVARVTDYLAKIELSEVDK